MKRKVEYLVSINYQQDDGNTGFADRYACYDRIIKRKDITYIKESLKSLDEEFKCVVILNITKLNDNLNKMQLRSKYRYKRS